MKTKEVQEFKIEDLIGACTGILLGKMDGIYEVISHLAGYSVFTHEIPVLFPRASEVIYQQYPAFKAEKENVPKGKPEAIPAYIQNLKEKYGDKLPLTGSISTEGSHKLLEGKEVIVCEVSQ